MLSIKIEDKINGYLTFDLKDILEECIIYRSHDWLAWNVDCFSSHWYERFESAGKLPVKMSFDEVAEYAMTVGQTIWGIFVALSPNVTHYPEEFTPNTLLELSDLLIQAFDSTYFEVMTDDTDLIKRLSNKFQHITISG